MTSALTFGYMRKDNGITWTNERRRLGDLTPWPINPRQIKKDEAARLSQSLDEFAQVETIAVGPDNEVYNGHQRLNVWSADHGPDYEVDVRVSNRPLSEDERKKLTVFLHKGAAGEWDFDMMANHFDVDDLLDWGFDAKELDLDMWGDDPADDPGTDIDRAEELREKWGVESGQLWQLGEHRLICGDCTDAETVARVMDGGRAGAVVTDPPYGMDLNTDYSSMPENRIASKTYARVEGDNKAFDVTPFIELFDYVKEQFWWGGDYYYTTLPVGGSWIVWDKRNENSDGLVGNHFELCWSRTPHRRRMIRVHWSGVNARNQGMERSHPTEKSINVIGEIITDYTSEGHIVVDLFAGVGTTLIACERLGRKCRAVEISPAYCAVAIERWHQMTGQEPVLVT